MSDGPKGESEAVPAALGEQGPTPSAMPASWSALAPWWDQEGRPQASGPLSLAAPLPPIFETASRALREAGDQGGGEAPALEAPRPREPRWQAVEALERQAAGMLARGLDRDAAGALGLLVGRRGRWVLHRSALVLGRREPGLDAAPKRGPDPPLPERLPLDINLALELGEADAKRVSRRQALLWVTATDSTACFRVARLGRGALTVDGVPVAQGASVALKHGALLQVGSAFLLVLVNEAALRRLVGRTRASCA